jgi:exopolysaccharide production protein ExoY
MISGTVSQRLQSSPMASADASARTEPAHIAGSGLAQTYQGYLTLERGGLYRAAGKRLFDIVMALVGLVAAAPVILVLSLVIATDGGSPIYSQSRVGRDGRLFRCLKLRSMTMNSAERLREILATDPEALAEWTASQKLTNDPRITRLGQFLRKSSLDELPQLWNVLRGDMSMVGPRPVVPDELARYGTHAQAYLRLRPGATGAWQVSARNAISYDERVRMDVDYEHGLSFSGDMAILVKTLGVVVAATGK